MAKKLSRNFYMDQDVLRIAQSLLGKFLVTKLSQNIITSGMITDVEAYRGSEDKASHAYGNKRTARTETMYMRGGHAYIYLCYGLHHIFNIVTAQENIPHCIMLRALLPCEGISAMLKRRASNKIDLKLTTGPGNLTKALGLKLRHDKIDLCGDQIWLEDRLITVKSSDIETTTRIGIAYAQEDAKLPWRFRLKDHLLSSNFKEGLEA